MTISNVGSKKFVWPFHKKQFQDIVKNKLLKGGTSNFFSMFLQNIRKGSKPDGQSIYFWVEEEEENHEQGNSNL